MKSLRFYLNYKLHLKSIEPNMREAPLLATT